MSNSIIHAMKRRLDDLEREVELLKQQAAEAATKPGNGLYTEPLPFTSEPIKRGPGRPRGTPNGR